MNLIYKLTYNLESRESINILMYHGFTNRDGQQGFNAHHGKHLHVDKLHQQLAWLKQYYHVISLRHLIAFYRGEEGIPERSVVITIDDGYYSNYALAYPVLCEFSLPATIFVATDFIDQKEFLWVDRVEYALACTNETRLIVGIKNDQREYVLSNLGQKRRADSEIKTILKRFSPQVREQVIQEIENNLKVKLAQQSVGVDLYRPLTWTQMSEMIHSGLVTIGSHGSSHTIATSLTPDEWADDLKRSRERIQKMTRTRCELFSYPNGGEADFNDKARDIVEATGFQCALTTIAGTNHRSEDPFTLKRLNIHNAGDMDGFVRTLSSSWRWLRRLKNASFIRD